MTTSFSEAEDGLTLVASTQTYVGCLAAGRSQAAQHREAWDEFYRSYRPLVDQAAQSQRRDCSTTIVDATQEIWLAVVERLASFQVDASLGSFPGWLRTIARRRLADGRRARRRRPIPPTWDRPPHNLVGPDIDPAQACEQAEEQLRLRALLDRLRGEVSALNYRILHLRSIEERTVAEVSDLVGLSTPQVRDRHHRMIIRLRELAHTQPVVRRSKKIAGYPKNRPIPGQLVTCM